MGSGPNVFSYTLCLIYTKVFEQRSDAGVVVKLHSTLEKLYDIIIEPFSEHAWFKQLDPKSTLVFVPDKVPDVFPSYAIQVPFALLRDKKTQKYLFQLHPIAIAPSLRVLQHCERRLRDLDRSPLKPDGCILAVGIATYKTINSLPGTGKELEHLRSCFAGRVKTLEKDEATRGNFLELVEEASHSKEEHVFAFIHLGVHGHWKAVLPASQVRSTAKQNNTGSLQFAKPSTGGSSGPTADISSGDLIRTGQSHASVPEEEFNKSEAESSSDGGRRGSTFSKVGSNSRAGVFKSTAAEDMLLSEDIVKSGLQWRTRLAILSACNSSRGLQDYSDGEVNLPRALMIAGVPAAVVSQWKIDDLASPRTWLQLSNMLLQLLNDRVSGSADNIFEWGPFLVWGLPTVQLPKDLWTENARNLVLSARQQTELLRKKFDLVEQDNVKVVLLNALRAVITYLEAAYNDACALEYEAIIGAIDNTERLLNGPPQVSVLRELEVVTVAMNLAEEVYSVVPSEQLKRVELELEKQYFTMFMIFLRIRVMYTQAMKGSHRIALDYANMLIEVIENAYGCTTYNKSIVQIFGQHKAVSIRQERAVILRLMGEYEEARKEFDDLVAPGEDYACLIQMSYLKYLMEDKSGALEYARRAKKLESPEFDMPAYRFTLGIKALPHEYRQWLLNVDVDDV